ncbi:MAG TPA: DUF3185 family protein [Xanthomonadales bacterium]|nr:DUF3185 family protein [Xanthomonadales bacterium]
MKNTKIIGIVLLVVGAILLYFGFNATQSATEEIGEALTGKYTDETMLFLIGGGVAAILGLFLMIKK